MSRRPTPERITMALDARGLYGPGVDAACGVAEPVVDLWETGELVPSPAQLAALAELTQFPVEFFFQPPSPPVTGGFLCIRSGRGKGCRPLGEAAAAGPAQLAFELEVGS